MTKTRALSLHHLVVRSDRFSSKADPARMQTVTTDTPGFPILLSRSRFPAVLKTQHSQRPI